MKYILLISLFMLDISLAYSSELKYCTKQEIIQKEKYELKNKKDSNLNYRIMIFNKKVELPKRFELLISGSIDDIIVFTTSLNTQDTYQNRLGCKPSTVVTGNIEVGNRKSCKLCDDAILVENKFEIIKTTAIKDIKYIEVKKDGVVLGLFCNDEN